MSDSTNASHWLWRLDAPQWLAAAKHEWMQAQALMHQRRSCVTHLRRAAGMGLNAVLVQTKEHSKVRPGFDPEAHWGRSYMDHLQSAAQDPYPLREHMAAVIERLQTVSLHSPNPGLVALRTGPSLAMTHALNDTQEILEACAEYCSEG